MMSGHAHCSCSIDEQDEACELHGKTKAELVRERDEYMARWLESPMRIELEQLREDVIWLLDNCTGSLCDNDCSCRVCEIERRVRA